MTHRPSRRRFLQTSAAASLALPAASCLTQRAKPRFVLDRQRHAGIAVGGMGRSDLDQIASHPNVDIVALCDVDLGRLKAAQEKYPDARAYQDWRELMHAERGQIDSVHVSTPDHMHAPIIMEALRNDLHVYGQKPLTHDVVEARRIAQAAWSSPVVTQMGIQNRAAHHYRRAKEILQSGIIGRVIEVHVWTDRPSGWWPQDVGRPEGSDEVPENLDWDLWIGTAPMRPYKEGSYHAFAWRGRMDFGTGAQGDMACHLMDPALWYLELGDPVSVRSIGPVPNGETFPAWSTVHYSFPATRYTVPEGVRVSWYDGGKMPTDKLELFDAGEDVYKNACYFIGEEGALLASPYEPPRLLPERDHPEVPDYDLPKINHWHQWVDACAGRGEATASFDYAGLLTEVALLGNVALRFPDEELQWDAKRLSFPARTEANQYLRRTYRDGWHVRGLG